MDVFIGDVVETARVQSITQRRAYGRKDATDDAVVSYVVSLPIREARDDL